MQKTILTAVSKIDHTGQEEKQQTGSEALEDISRVGLETSLVLAGGSRNAREQVWGSVLEVGLKVALTLLR